MPDPIAGNPGVLFVCVHNAGRSQMAAWFSPDTPVIGWSCVPPARGCRMRSGG